MKQQDNSNRLIIYQDDNGVTKVNVRFADEDVWLTQQQLAEIYDTTKQNISQHIDNIFKDGELDENRTVKDFLTVRFEGTGFGQPNNQPTVQTATRNMACITSRSNGKGRT